MREILFRGKLADQDEWVEGSLVLHGEDAMIFAVRDFPKGTGMFSVDPTTVGQYTGLTANGEKIFEGDIVKGIFLFGEQILSVVKFSEGSFGLAWQRGNVKEFSPFTGMCNVEYEVIGNIHDNPELLEQKSRDSFGSPCV